MSRATFVAALVVAAALLAACVQQTVAPTATPAPIVSPTPEPSATAAPIPAAATPTGASSLARALGSVAAASPSATPVPAAVAPQDADALLQRVNAAMAGVTTLYMDGQMDVKASPDAATNLISTRFTAAGKPGGDGWTQFAMTISTAALQATVSFETRTVNDVRYAQDPVTKEWALNPDPKPENDVLGNAMNGRLRLERATASVDSLDGEPVYRISGGFSANPGAAQVVVWVGTTDYLVRQIQTEGYAPASDYEGVVPQGGKDLFQRALYRVDQYGKPVTVTAPMVKAQPATSAGAAGQMASFKSSHYPFAIQFPAGWKQEPDAEGVTASFTSDQGDVFVVTEEDMVALGYGETTLEQYVDMVLSSLKAGLPGLQLVSRTKVVTAQGLPAELLVLAFEDGSIKASRLIHVYQDRVAFNATYQAPSARHKALEPVIAQSFGTFEVAGALAVAPPVAVTPAPTSTPTVAQGTAPASQQSLLGTWQCQVEAGGQTGSAAFVFESESRLRVNETVFSYALTSGGISIGGDVYTLAQTSDRLTMTFPQDGTRFECTRSVGATTTAPAPSTGGSQPSLLGTWQCQVNLGGQTTSAVFAFESESRLVINGTGFDYKLVPGGINVGGSEYTLSLTGDTFVMTYSDGSRFDCTRSSAATGTTGQSGPTGTGQEYLLKGTFCSWASSGTSSSTYTSSGRVTFDGQGRFTLGSESSFSSEAGSAFGAAGSGEIGTYQLSGDTIYLTLPGQSTVMAKVNYRGSGGTITEIMYGETLYAPGLCG